MQTETIRDFARARASMGKEEELRGFKLIKAGDLKIKAPVWLIHGLIEDDTNGLMFGDSGGGKTFIAVDFALCIATGTPYHGKQVKQGAVVYIIGEGKNGFSRRCIAWSIKNGVDYQDAPFFVSTMPAAFLYPESVEQVTAAIAAVKPVLIVVDTLARNYGPGDENSTADMNKFITAVDYVRRPHNATALIVHHTGHGEKERSRGAYALTCGVDFEYRVKRGHDGIIVVDNTKMKDGEKPEPMAFTADEIKLVGDDGQRMTSLALELTEIPERETATTIPRAQRVALDALKKLSQDNEKVDLDDWRAECYAAGISGGKAESAKRKAFYIARESLLDAGLIETRNDKYWIPLPTVT